MTRILLIALAAVTFSTSVFAQDATEEVTAEEREAFHEYVEGLREAFDPETDGNFRDYVAAAAAEDGVELPDAPRGGKGPGRDAESAEAGAGEDRPSRGEAGEGPSRGEGGEGPSRG